jgi:MFS family permease
MIISFFVVLGQGLFYLGVQQTYLPLLIIGRFVLGLGGESLVVAQARITCNWYHEHELGFAIGFHLALARFGSVLNDLCTPWISTHFGANTASLGAFLLCAVSMASGYVACLLDTMRERAMDLPCLEGKCLEANLLDDSMDLMYPCTQPSVLHTTFGTEFALEDDTESTRMQFVSNPELGVVDRCVNDTVDAGEEASLLEVESVGDLADPNPSGKGWVSQLPLQYWILAFSMTTYVQFLFTTQIVALVVLFCWTFWCELTHSVA